MHARVSSKQFKLSVLSSKAVMKRLIRICMEAVQFVVVLHWSEGLDVGQVFTTVIAHHRLRVGLF